MMKKNLLPLLLLLFFFSNCKKDNNIETPLEQEEFNETCNKLVQEGLTINVDGDISSQIDPGNMQAFTDFNNCVSECTDPNDLDCMMNCMSLLGVMPPGGAFSLTCYITNTTTTTITFILEAGDWFQPSSDDYQPMLCPIDISVVIEAGQTTTVLIPVYCLNSGLSSPADDSDYTICDMISSNDCLLDIIGILKTKDLSSITYLQATEVQKIIWNCTEGESVDLEYLNNLPSL